jgi:hypothetical protein
MKKHTLFSVLGVALFGVLTSLTAHAQGPGSVGPAAPTAVPIDGGASLLIASGAAYGLRKLRQRRAQK